MSSSVDQDIMLSNITEMCSDEKKYTIEDIQNVMNVMESVKEAVRILTNCGLIYQNGLMQPNKTNHELISESISIYQKEISANNRRIKLLKKVQELAQYQEIRHLIDQTPLSAADIVAEIKRIKSVERLKND